jgi:hypothetical protein
MNQIYLFMRFLSNSQECNQLKLIAFNWILCSQVNFNPMNEFKLNWDSMTYLFIKLWEKSSHSFQIFSKKYNSMLFRLDLFRNITKPINSSFLWRLFKAFILYMENIYEIYWLSKLNTYWWQTFYETNIFT